MSRYYLGHGPIVPAEWGAGAEYPPEWDDEPDDGRAYCHRTDGACTGRACWVCQPDTPTSSTTNNTDGTAA